MIGIGTPEHAIFYRAIFHAGRRARTARAVLIDYGQNVWLALAFVGLAFGLRLVLYDFACDVLFDARCCVAHNPSLARRRPSLSPDESRQRRAIGRDDEESAFSVTLLFLLTLATMSMCFASRNFVDASSGLPCYNDHALVALVKTFCSVKRGCESTPLVSPFSVFGLKGRRPPFTRPRLPQVIGKTRKEASPWTQQRELAGPLAGPVVGLIAWSANVGMWRSP